MNTVKKIIPKYAIIPLISVFILNLLTYYGTRLINKNCFHYDLSGMFDISVPFLPTFIIFYVIAYLQWFVGFILIARESRDLCYSMLTGEMIAKLITFIIFIIFPTTMARPEITGTGIFDKLTQLIYSIDTPDNLFPSIHCLGSWLCFRGALEIKSIRKWYAPLSLAVSILVFLSTIFIAQHALIDIPAGIIVAELGIIISKLTRADRIFDWVNSKFMSIDVRREPSLEQ